MIPIRVENQRKFREDLKAVVNLMRWLTNMERDPKYDRGDIDSEIEDFIRELNIEHSSMQRKLKNDLGTIRGNIKAVNKDIDRLKMKMAQLRGPNVKSLKGSWEFGRKTGPKDKGLDKAHIIGTVTLTLDKVDHGYIIGGPYRHDNESFWDLEGNTLLFKHKDGTVTTSFSSNDADWNSWEGSYLPNKEPKVQGVIHYLKRK